MTGSPDHTTVAMKALRPLREAPQLGARVYQAVVNSILSGHIQSGAALRPDVIARQLGVSTTPVREAMHRLESDGLLVKWPNRGWFVREFTGQQIRDLYEFRSSLECLGVRLACERRTEGDLTHLYDLQIAGESALQKSDMDAYRAYNEEFHATILTAARNSYLSSVMSQLRSQNEMLIVKTMRIVGRPLRAIDEHARLIELLSGRDARAAEQLMGTHILGALDDLLRTAVDPPQRSQNGRSVL